MMSGTVGIIGGMGPMATCDLFRKIIENTKAERDQDHIHVVIDSNTNIPDRTEAILRGGPSPVGEIVKSARFLETMHPDVLLLPCNTSHYYYDEIVSQIHTPLLHMPHLTVEYLKRKRYRRVGLLATEGTIKSGVYTRLLEEAKIAAVVPSDEEQKEVTCLIYDGIKANNADFDTANVKRVLARMRDAGAETMLLGCTELSVAFQVFDLGSDYVDPQTVVAREAVKLVKGNLMDEA